MPQWSWPGNSPSRSSCWKASSRPAGRFSLFPLPQHQNAALLLSCCPHPWTPQTIYVYFQGPVLDLRVAAGFSVFSLFLWICLCIQGFSLCSEGSPAGPCHGTYLAGHPGASGTPPGPGPGGHDSFQKKLQLYCICYDIADLSLSPVWPQNTAFPDFVETNSMKT